MISSVIVVVVVVVVRVDTNFGISQHQGTCAACKRHLSVATGGKLAPSPSNQFNTTGVCIYHRSLHSIVTCTVLTMYTV